jgi:hypothetical protein
MAKLDEIMKVGRVELLRPADSGQEAIQVFAGHVELVAWLLNPSWAGRGNNSQHACFSRVEVYVHEDGHAQFVRCLTPAEVCRLVPALREAHRRATLELYVADLERKARAETEQTARRRRVDFWTSPPA